MAISTHLVAKGENIVSNSNLLEELRAAHAILDGHFLLTSGWHSRQFFQMARVVEQPSLLQTWCQRLAGLMPASPTCVAAPLGGIVISYEMAHIFHGRSISALKSPEGTMILPEGLLTPGEEVVIIEDAVATGLSVRKVIRAVTEQGGRVKAIGALVNRAQTTFAPLPFYAVLDLGQPVPSWKPEDCPLCQQGVPLVRPKT